MEYSRDVCRVSQKLRLPYEIFIADQYDCIKCQREITGGPVLSYYSDADKCYRYDFHCFWKQMKEGSNAISLDSIHGIDNLPPLEQRQLIVEVRRYNNWLRNNPDTIMRTLFDNNNELPMDMTPRLIVIWSQYYLVHFDPRQPACCICHSNTKPDKKLPRRFCLNGSYAHINCLLHLGSVFIGNITDVCGVVCLAENERLKDLYKRRLRTVRPSRSQNLYVLDQPDRFVLFFSWLEIIFPASETSYFCSLCMKFVELGSIVVKHLNLKWHLNCLLKTCSVICELPKDIQSWEHLSDQRKTFIEQCHFSAVQSGTIALSLPRINAREEQRQSGIEFVNVEGETSTASEEVSAKKQKIVCNRDDDDIVVIDDDDWDNGNADIDDDSWRQQHYYAQICLEARKNLRSPDHALESIRGISRIYNYSKNYHQIIEPLVDACLYGKPDRCPECNHQLTYVPSRRAFVCEGYRTKYSRCEYSTRTPPRIPVVVPPLIRECASYDPTFESTNRYFVEDHEEVTSTTIKVHSRSQMRQPDIGFRFGGLPMLCIDGIHNSYDVVGTADGLYQALIMQVDVVGNKRRSTELFILKDLSEFVLVKRINNLHAFEPVSSIQKTYIRTFDQVKELFEKAFYTATRNEWRNRHIYEKIPLHGFWIETAQIGQRDLDEDPVRQFLRHINDHTIQTEKFKSKFEYHGPLAFRTRNFLMQTLIKLLEKLRAGTATEDECIDASNIYFSVDTISTEFGSTDLLNTKEKVKMGLSNLHKRTHFNTTVDHFEICQEVYDELHSQLIVLDFESRDSPSSWILNYQRATCEERISKTNPVLARLFAFDDRRNFQSDDSTMWLWHAVDNDKMMSVLRNGLQVETDGIDGEIMFTDSFKVCAKKHKNYFDRNVYVLLCKVRLGVTQTHKDIRPAHDSADLFDSVLVQRRSGLTGFKETYYGAYVFTNLMKHYTLSPSQPALHNDYYVKNGNQVSVQYILHVKFDR